MKKQPRGHQWTTEEIKICKRFFPILGNRKPKFHPSLMEMLPHLTEPQILNFCYKKLNIKVNLQKGVRKGKRRCKECLVTKEIKSFKKISPSKEVTKKNKGYSFQCIKCIQKIRLEFRKNNRLLLVLEEHMRKEKSYISRDNTKSVLNKIINKIGLPSACFFKNRFCGNVSKNQSLIELGHKTSVFNGGSVTDPNNLFWVCERHNLIIGKSNFDEFGNIISKMIKKL